jgi:uncharacterized repeat protein (TIGR01451 family)
LWVALAILLFPCAATRAAVATAADLSLLKTADPEPVKAGSTLTYTITLSNEGPDDAATVVLSDPLPAGLTFRSLSAPGGWSCTTPAIGTNGTISCSIPIFPPNSAVFTIAGTVGASVPDGTILTNTATVTSATADPRPGNESATANSTVGNPPSASVNVAKAGAPNPVAAGNDITYTITVTNGAVDLDSAAIHDTLPANTTFVSLTAAAGWSCTAPAAGAAGTINCSTGTVPAGSNATFTLVAHVAAARPAGALTNTVSLDSSVGGRNATTSASAVNQVVASADFAVAVADAPDPVTAGSNLVYTIVVSSAGPSNAPSATLTDALPAGTTFVSLVTPAGWTCATPAAGAAGSVSCNTSVPFAPGSATFTLTVATSAALPSGTVLTDTAIVTSAADGNAANNSGSATTVVRAAPITIPALGGKELALLALLLAVVAMFRAGHS